MLDSLFIGINVKRCEMNIFKEIVLSIDSFKSYKEFLNNKKSRVFGFGVVVPYIYVIIAIVMMLAYLWMTALFFFVIPSRISNRG